ncbi:glycosyltransferase [Microbulbifer sp. TYP-18]|uniref:glycosyltransferase n=1 Tax=Microbulbifer sp. TYP-18 TaxID=3230024 RepID=UPI0034C64A4B
MIALVPDRFALYRYPVFRKISEEGRGEGQVVIYADPREDSSNIRLAPVEYCNLNPKEGGIRWVPIRSLYFRKICFWQTGLQALVLFGRCKVIVYWGEAHRLSTWMSAVLARLLGKRVVFWTHGIYGNEGALKRLIRVCFYRLADGLLLYGQYGRRQLERAGIPAERLWVINNSLDVMAQLAIVNSVGRSELKSLRRNYCDDSERLFVFVGRLEPQKRLDMLVEAVVLLNERGVASRALIIGDGSEYESLTRQAQRLGVEDKIVFYGECYEDAQVLPILNIADICVSPGEIGLTAMHALIAGTPVITHDDFANQMPECEAVRVGESGFFFSRGSVNDLVEKVTICLEALDKGQITQESCRGVVEKEYTPEYQRSVFYRAVDPLLG